MKLAVSRNILLLGIGLLVVGGVTTIGLNRSRASAAFRDDFDGALVKDSAALQGWSFFSGDGRVTTDLRAGTGFASLLVDATKDRRNVWWAVIRRHVSADLDLGRVSPRDHELRVEARIRVSHAPRRVNLHLQTQRTTDFHSHLMEFDIPDTKEWHTISMTTRNFEVAPGDKVFAQLAMMDWGISRYQVDVDYLSVCMVPAASPAPDQGTQVPYHPPIPDVSTLAEQTPPIEDAVVDEQYGDTNLDGWCAQDADGNPRVLSVGGTQSAILRWDLSRYAGRHVDGYGVLELVTHSVERLARPVKDFGLVRVVEILSGDRAWRESTVTFESLCRGQPSDEVLNPQPIIDYEVAAGRGNKTLLVVSKPVLERLISGQTLGLAVRPLGALHAAFYASEHPSGPRLRFNLQK